MNCFHFSVPASAKLNEFLAQNPEAQNHRTSKFGDTHIASHEILAPAARRLIEPNAKADSITRSVDAIDRVLELLSEDDRVQGSLGDYYGVHLLVTELETAAEDFRRSGRRSRFLRVANKLLRELNHPDRASKPSASDQARARNDQANTSC